MFCISVENKTEQVAVSQETFTCSKSVVVKALGKGVKSAQSYRVSALLEHKQLV